MIVLLGIVAAIGPLAFDLYLSSFPEIATDLQTPINYVSLSLTAYMVGIAIGQLVNGPLLDRYGRQGPLIWGLALFIAGSLGCAVAPNIYVLILLRFVMALGGSVGMVATRAIIRDNFEHNEMARAFSALILVFGVAPIVAPIMGSLVLNYFGWRFNFVLLAIYAGAAIFLILRYLKNLKGPELGLSISPKNIFHNYVSLLNLREYMTYAIAGCFAMLAMFSFLSGSSYVIRGLLGFDEIDYAWIFGLNAAAYISASQINRSLLKRYDMQVLSRRFSFLYLLLGIPLMIQVYLGIPSVGAFLGNLIIFLSMLGLINPNVQALAMEPHKERAGFAAALLGALRMLVGALGSAYISFFHDESAWPMISLMGISALVLFVSLRLMPKAAQNQVYAND